MNAHDMQHNIVDATTSAPATAISVAGGWIGYILGNQGTVLFCLSASIMLIQLGLFAYRFFVWLRCKKSKKK